MDCTRCHGLLVPDCFSDLEDDTGQGSFQGWRCPSCGEICDPLILYHRTARPRPLVNRARSKIARRLDPFLAHRP